MSRLGYAMAMALGIALPLWWRQIRWEREAARAMHHYANDASRQIERAWTRSYRKTRAWSPN